MGFNFKSDKYDTQSIYKRIVLRVDKYRSVSSSIIDDTPEALKDEASQGTKLSLRERYDLKAHRLGVFNESLQFLSLIAIFVLF